MRISDGKIVFGKHIGKSLRDVPKSYLRWMLDNVTMTAGEREAANQAYEQASDPPARPKQSYYGRVCDRWEDDFSGMNDPFDDFRDQFNPDEGDKD